MLHKVSKRFFSTATTTTPLTTSLTTHQFNANRLTFDKLKDKCQVDAEIKQVCLAFVDQFGRLHGTQLNAEYFIEKVSHQSLFTTS